jgi:hypothetical protein
MKSSMIWEWHVTCMRDIRKSYKIISQKPQGSVQSPGQAWRYNIKMNQIGYDGVNWNNLAQDWD